jgi:hypothetical protein
MIYTGPQIVTTDLVFYLDAGNPKSYPGTGTTWYNRASSDGVFYDAAALNSPTFSSLNNGTIVFDGVNSYYQSTATTNSVGMIGGNFTVNIWFYTDLGYTSSVIGQSGCMFASDTASVPGGAYQIVFRNSNLYVSFYANDQNIPHIPSQWFMLTHTYNFTTKISKIYRNGVLLNTITRTIDLTATGFIKIGRGIFAAGFFNGKIPIVQIYKRDISADEVLQNFNADKSKYGL